MPDFILIDSGENTRLRDFGNNVVQWGSLVSLSLQSLVQRIRLAPLLYHKYTVCKPSVDFIVVLFKMA